MTLTPWSITAVAVLVLALTGCSDAPEARLVASWSQGTHPDLRPDDPDLRTRLVDTTTQRKEVLARLPSSIPRAELAPVEAIDLSRHVIVLGSYSRCTQRGRVTVEGGALRFVVENPEPGTACAWAPLQVEVWVVEREGLDTPPRLEGRAGRETQS